MEILKPASEHLLGFALVYYAWNGCVRVTETWCSATTPWSRRVNGFHTNHERRRLFTRQLSVRQVLSAIFD